MRKILLHRYPRRPKWVTSFFSLSLFILRFPEYRDIMGGTGEWYKRKGKRPKCPLSDKFCCYPVTQVLNDQLLILVVTLINQIRLWEFCYKPYCCYSCLSCDLSANIANKMTNTYRAMVQTHSKHQIGKTKANEITSIDKIVQP